MSWTSGPFQVTKRISAGSLDLCDLFTRRKSHYERGKIHSLDNEADDDVIMSSASEDTDSDYCPTIVSTHLAPPSLGS